MTASNDPLGGRIVGDENISLRLRICSAHFEGGEKKEGDIPVPDPQLLY
uniref:THAP-type domain-containing protein n=1 Tax=Ascaris lumbricoides TaxID=6252 RepID=A0A0M3HNE8_ASCLU